MITSVRWLGLFVVVIGILGIGAVFLNQAKITSPVAKRVSKFMPRLPVETSGFTAAISRMKPWKDPNSLDEIRKVFEDLGHRRVAEIKPMINEWNVSPHDRMQMLMLMSTFSLYEGDTSGSMRTLDQCRKEIASSPELATKFLYTIVFMQGVTGLRQGENDNCLDCRGTGACIFPLSASAIHRNPTGSRLAIQYFTEYLDEFPDDPGVRWLLNLAYMTLGEHPAKVPEAYVMHFEKFGAEYDIGRFVDISHRVGLDRTNEAGGAVMDDFHNQGRLDVVVTSSDPGQSMALYRNKGDGTFENRTEFAGLTNQLGGLNLVQTDYNNDGLLDLFVIRGAWLQYPVRPSLLRNNGDGTFTDVTREAGLMDPINSVSASWGDFDNDGHLDLFICNERGPNRLYRNRGDGTFENVTAKARVGGKLKNGKGAVWIDYDNDGYPDLFVNYLESTPQLYHNNRDGTFTDVTQAMGIKGPERGFSCWAFDYDNDGWIDILTTCYDRTLDNMVRGVHGDALDEGVEVTRLYHNDQGKRFSEVSKAMGINKVFATMGSNFADFDNDGFLDFYLATGEPSYASLVPNRMFKNVEGKRFAEITATSGTGHLQKGHGVACGDWDRDGNIDLFVQTGGAVPGDRYHNVLFQNPGQGNNWLTLKLIGKKSNHAAIGARIKILTQGDTPLAIHRIIGSGSSFGGNPLQQTIGVGKSKKVTLEVEWPTTKNTQVFYDVAVNRSIELTEFATEFHDLPSIPIQVPKEPQ